MLSSLDAHAHAVVFQIKTKKNNNYNLLQNWWEFKVFSVPNTFRSGIYYALNFTWLWKKKKKISFHELILQQKKHGTTFPLRCDFSLFLDTFKLIDLFLTKISQMRWIFFAAWRDWALTAPWCNLDRDLCCTMITETYITCIESILSQDYISVHFFFFFLRRNPSDGLHSRPQTRLTQWHTLRERERERMHFVGTTLPRLYH